MQHPISSTRRGSIIPLLLISLTTLCAFVALAVDLGMLATAREQCQNAADAAALAGASSLDGSATGNVTQATTNATNAATANKILSSTVTASEVSVRHGSYHYSTSTESFSPQFPPVAPDNYNLTEATVTRTGIGAFSRVLGLTGFTVSITATAAHRPRDVAIVLDYSGSMNNESDLWNNESYLGSVNNSSNNSDPVFPEFGPYNQTYSPLAKLQCTSSDTRVGKCNITQAVLGVPAMVDDFYKNSRGAAASAAFTPAASGVVTNLLSGGDKYQNVALSLTTPAKNWKEITGSASVGFVGYPAFNGYTQGPGYWGKTFFIWPPDPAAAKDWRKKYLMLTGGAYPTFGGPVSDNTQLWDSSGNWLDPAGNYVINYKAILTWIKKAPKPFPTQLRAGGVLFYSAIPSDVPSAAYDHTQPNSNIANADQRFWKEYIDYTIGVWRDPLGNIQRPGNPSCSYGPDFNCGSSSTTAGIQITGPDTTDPLGRNYIAPLDNPKRPRHRFWFGPMTMIQYMMDTGLLPGTAHDISMCVAKLGVQGALQDIQNNHPNDMVSLIMFSRPNYTGEPAEAGEFNQAVVDLGRNYTSMIDALWYPPTGKTTDVRPWDSNGLQTPRAHGDYTGNTATSFGLMVAYNQFSGSSYLRTQGLGGYGRKGAQKIVILETDGMANTSTDAGSTSAGAYQSYFNIGPSDTFNAGGQSASQDAVDVATRICALDSDNTGVPGYGTVRKPVQIHTLAFGAVFEPTAEGAEPASAVSFLQQLSTVGGTVFPSSASDPTNGYKWCVGTLTQRQNKLQQAFTTIMDNTVSVVLVK